MTTGPRICLWHASPEQTRAPVTLHASKGGHGRKRVAVATIHIRASAIPLKFVPRAAHRADNRQPRRARVFKSYRADRRRGYAGGDLGLEFHRARG
jgi:hypothetical protein